MRASSIVKLVILVFLVGLIGTVLYEYGGRFNEQELEKLQNFVQDYRPYDELIYVLSCAVAPMIFLPDTIFNLIGAEIFPPVWWGSLLCSLGVILGSVPSYFIGGFLGHEVVSRWAGEHLKELDKRIKKFGFWGMLFFPGGSHSSLRCGQLRRWCTESSLSRLSTCHRHRDCTADVCLPVYLSPGWICISQPSIPPEPFEVG